MTALPTGWRAATLGEVARWGSGGTPTASRSDYYGGPIPWAVIGDLSEGPVRQTRSAITHKALQESSAKLVPPGAVLIAMYGSIGKLGITEVEMATNQAIAFAVPYDGLDTRYLFYYLLSQRDELGRAGKGATQQNIGQAVLKAWPIVMPQLDEQRRIVDILEDHLSRLDAADKSLQRARQRSRSMSAAVLDSVIVDSDEQCSLRDLVERVETGRSYGGSAPPAGPDEWGIIRVSAMTWGEFRAGENKAVPSNRADPRYEIKVGDLLVSRANTSAYVGAAVLVRDTRARLLLSDKSLRLVPRQGVNPDWLQLALSAPTTRRQISARATGTKDSMRNISQAALLGIQVPQKPAISQAADLTRCRELLDAADRLSSTATVTTTRSRSLHRALLAAAFTGHLTGHAADLDRAEELIT